MFHPGTAKAGGSIEFPQAREWQEETENKKLKTTLPGVLAGGE